MKRLFRNHALGMLLIAASNAASALPLSVVGGSGFSGPIPVPVAVTLNDTATIALEAATVVIEFDTARLDYTSVAPGNLFPAGTINFENLADEALGRVILSISSNANPMTGSVGSLLDVSFNILANAPVGLASVTFRCLPIDPQRPVDAVTDQTLADHLCAPDYAIPPTTGNVAVLARTDVPGQVPIPSTAWLALLGLGLMTWARRQKQ